MIGQQSVAGVIPWFGVERQQQIPLGTEVQAGRLEDATLIFHVSAPEVPTRQVKFTLTVSGETMTGTLCGDTCGVLKLKNAQYGFQGVHKSAKIRGTSPRARAGCRMTGIPPALILSK